jgi:multiple sugar transport system substrate-binding protein
VEPTRSLRWLYLVGVIGAFMLLAGVTASAGVARTDSPSSSEGLSGTVTLRGWSVGPDEEQLLRQVISTFERRNPNIKVNYDSLGNYDQAMLASFSARRPPDAFYLNSEVAPTWIAQGLIEPLDSRIKRDKFATKPFFPSLLNAFKRGGKTYGFPKDWSPLGMQVNAALLARAGVKVPRTWAQLRTAAQRLRSVMPEGGRPICLASEWQRMLAFVFQNYGAVLRRGRPNFSSPGVRGGVNYYVGLQKAGLGDRPAKLGAGWCGEALGKGTAAIAFEGNWVYPYLPNNFPNIRWRFHPIVKGKTSATLAFTVAYSTGRHSANKELAWRLIKYLTGREGMRIWTSKGLALPARSDVKVRYPGPSRAPLLAEARYSRPWVWPAGWNKVWEVGNNELTAVFEGRQTVNGMLSRMQSEAQAARAANN